MVVYNWFDLVVDKVTDGDTLSGLLCRVRDIRVVGGRVQVRYVRTSMRLTVRVRNIDAPESKQQFGKEAQKFLSKMVLGQTVQCRMVGKQENVSGQSYFDFSGGFDKYGRYLCDVGVKDGFRAVPSVVYDLGWLHSFEGSGRVDVAMISAGWAWHYEKYSDNLILNDLQVQARNKKLGLWAGALPVAPWIYRKNI